MSSLSDGFIISLPETAIRHDFLRAKSEMHARTPHSAEHALAFGETWSNTILDFPMKIKNLYHML